VVSAENVSNYFLVPNLKGFPQLVHLERHSRDSWSGLLHCGHSLMTLDKQNGHVSGVLYGSNPKNHSSFGSVSATQYVGAISCVAICPGSYFCPPRTQFSFWQIAIADSRSNESPFLFWSSACASFSHLLNLLKVFGTAFRRRLSATATEGNGGFIFLCHAKRIQKALAVVKRELCINSRPTTTCAISPRGVKILLVSSDCAPPSVLPGGSAGLQAREKVRCLNFGFSHGGLSWARPHVTREPTRIAETRIPGSRCRRPRLPPKPRVKM
jgi:hypothetical protein